MAEPEKLEALYFPFSRSIDPSSTKQMLLVFDSIHFLDPVDDDEWRAALMDEMVDRRFAGYRSVADALPTLVQEGAVVRRDPALLRSIKSATVAASAVGDLLEAGWVGVASAPERFGIPHLRAGAEGVATWESFDEKLPPAFVQALNEVPELRRHVILHGDSSETWVLSYEAGSAIALSSHLAAASELGLATVTDSRMHHQLLQSKARRIALTGSGSEQGSPVGDHPVAHSTAMGLLDDVLPRHALERIEFDELLRFRERTKSARADFVRELRSKLNATGLVASGEFARVEAELRVSLADDLRQYRAELAMNRDKCWPSLAGALSATLPTGGAAAVAMSYMGLPQQAFAAAGTAAGLAIAKTLLELRANQRSVKSRAAPVVSYLSQVKERFGK